MAQPLGAPEPRGNGRPRGLLRAIATGREAVPPPAGKTCSCGHGKAAHQHYRGGSDCSLCGCRRFHRSLRARLGLG